MTLADICLVPQVANARRFQVPLDKFPKIVDFVWAADGKTLTEFSTLTEEQGDEVVVDEHVTEHATSRRLGREHDAHRVAADSQ